MARRALVLATLLVVAAAAPAASATRVTLRTDDGVTLAAVVYEPSQRPAPAVLLVHMQGRSRRDWEPAAERLAARGLVAIAIDLRGHGESSGPAPDPAGTDFAACLLDLKAAVAYLLAHPELATSAVGIAGGSVGANLAVLGGASLPGVRAIALLSPGLEYRGVKTEAAMKKYGDRPALIVASKEDPYAWRSAKALAAIGSGTRELQLLEGVGHGTAMLARGPEVTAMLVDWFARSLL